MAKYHVNPTTGVPGECSATSGRCPFGGAEAHGATPHEAVENFEASYSTLPQGKTKDQPARDLGGEIQAINEELKELEDEIKIKKKAISHAEGLLENLADFHYHTLEDRQKAQDTMEWIISHCDARMKEIESESKGLISDRDVLNGELPGAVPPKPSPKKPAPKRPSSTTSDYSYNRKHGGKY